MRSRLFERAFSRWSWWINRFWNANRYRHRQGGGAIPFHAQGHIWSIRRLTALAAAPLLVTPSFAADYATREVGEWVVSASSDGKGCFLTRTYRGPRKTTLMFGLDGDDGNRLTILNANWSIREKEQLRLNFRLSNASFPRHLAVGLAADGKKGFVASFGAAFPGNFATSRSLRIARGDVPVEELSLDGSGAAVTELRKCVNLHRGTSAAVGAGISDTGHIPLDPFAVHAGRKSKKSRVAEDR